MPVTLDEVKKVLREEFPKSDVGGVTEKNHHVFGTIIWEGFKGKDSGERNRLVSEKVRDKFGLRGINVGFLFPLAPGEKP